MRLRLGNLYHVSPLVLFVALIGATGLPPERTPLLDPFVAPVSYDLTLEPHVPLGFGVARPVSGRETIVVRVMKRTRALILNSALTKIQHASIDGTPVRVAMYPHAQQLGLSSGGVIEPGTHSIALTFESTTFADAYGWWNDTERSDTPMLVSNFEFATARTLFPCFDEPQMRASFTLHVVAPKDWVAVSNMPVRAHVDLDANRRRTDFQPTPPMPTYRLTIDAGRFASVSGMAGKTPVTVYVQPGHEELAKQVLADTTASLTFFERDLGMPYPLPKLDYVIGGGILNDVADGYGAITTYTEFDVSGQQQQGGPKGRREAFEYVAGPIARQWFGGYVGIRWWSDAFVQQALSEYELERAEKALHPESSALGTSFSWSWADVYDAKPGTSVTRVIRDDRDSGAWQAFNGRLDLAPAILDAWSRYVGDDAMQQAVREFLHGYGNRVATTSDFWNEFHAPVADTYGHTWLDQPGTPVLFAVARCINRREIVDLSQSPARAEFSKTYRGESWPIPVVLVNDGASRRVLLRGSSGRYEVGPCGSIEINPGQRPPYFMHATGDIAAPHDMIERQRTFDDAYNLYMAHVLSITALNDALASYIAHTGDEYEIQQSVYALTNALTTLRGSSAGDRLGERVQQWADPLVSTMGFTAKWKQAPEKQWLVMSLLSQTSDKKAAAAAARAIPTDPSSVDYRLAWGLGPLAAQADDVVLLQRMLPAPAVGPYGALTPQLAYLFNVSEPSAVLAVLHSAQGRQGYEKYVTWLGARNPEVVSHYLDDHARDVMRTAPPSQQGWALTDVVTAGCWSARSPQEWRAFFKRYVHNPRVIDAAMRTIVKNWSERKQLERELQ